MSIESVNNIRSIIKNHDAKKWTSDINFNSSSNNLEKLNIDNLGEVKSAKSFTDMLSESLLKVNKVQNEANIAIQKLASGESKNIHETMLAVEKADIAFKTMNQIRGKIIDAYKEIMRMQV